MTTVFVFYPGDASTRFDRDYYTRTHIPLVMRAWGPHGLRSCTALFPPDANGPTLAAAICEFRDEAALQAALGSAGTPAVMADVVRFTDAQPVQRRAAAMSG